MCSGTLFFRTNTCIMKSKLSIILILMVSLLTAQTQLRTRIFDENIRSLQLKVNENALSLPVITLNGNDKLEISFDEMSHDKQSFSYEIIHCNADWTRSSLSSSEFLNGFDKAYIDDYALSINTTFLYTHYRVELPNNDVQLKISGNYLVSIFKDNNYDSPVAHACFSIVEPHVEIEAKVRGNTDTELNRSKQQLDFEVSMPNYRISDPQSEIKVLVRQNNRIDNQVDNVKASYYSPNKLSFINNRALIFEGGNEYNRVDFSSIYNYDERVEKIKFERPYYHVYLSKIQPRSSAPYLQDFDANGGFVINYQNGYEDVNLEADYMFVHLTLPTGRALTSGDVYVGGAWNFNLLNEASRMEYDPSDALYHKTLLLKQGGYNYQFWLLPRGEQKATVAPTDGSFWQTQNQYAIYIYHRAWGGRYDKLIGFKLVE